MYRTSSSSCSNEDNETFNSNSSTNSSFLIPSPPSYSSSSLLKPTSYSSTKNGYLHRSNSSHSLPIYHHHRIQDFVSNPTSTTVFPLSSLSSSCCPQFTDFNSMPMRRVFSTGDLQGMNGSQVLAENPNQEGNSSLPSQVTRYSAEEKKERIEKYRSKRNQRNFQKKITYACRKTLADSRPRVKGRFARNGEPETEAETELENFAANNYGCYNRGSYNTYEANSTNTSGDRGDLWRQIEQAMEADDDGSTYFADEEMWSNLSEILPMNMLS